MLVMLADDTSSHHFWADVHYADLASVVLRGMVSNPTEWLEEVATLAHNPMVEGMAHSPMEGGMARSPMEAAMAAG